MHERHFSVTTLFDPLRAGDLDLANRIVMAPLTRNRSPNAVPGDLAVTYYSQRAKAGLIVTEATAISHQGQGYAHVPGLYGADQLAGWSASPMPSTRPAARSWCSSGMSDASRTTRCSPAAASRWRRRRSGQNPRPIWSSRMAVASSPRPPSRAPSRPPNSPASSMIIAAPPRLATRRRFRRRRDPWCQWLSHRPVPALGHQPSHRQLWRLHRESHAPAV